MYGMWMQEGSLSAGLYSDSEESGSGSEEGTDDEEYDDDGTQGSDDYTDEEEELEDESEGSYTESEASVDHHGDDIDNDDDHKARSSTKVQYLIHSRLMIQFPCSSLHLYLVIVFFIL